MERTLIKDAKENLNQEIRIKGRVINLRKLGAVCFALVQDYSGQIQTVWEKEPAAKMGDAVEIIGQAKEDKRAKGGCEISGREMTVVAGSIAEYPFDLSKPQLNLQTPNLFDWRSLSLRHPKVQAIFKLYDLILAGYEDVMRREGFIEIKTPKILEAASEGGANFFKIKYFDKNAYLAQSPQLYKQIMVGVFERVFEIGSTFRAEPSFTTRHLTEYISLDAEMGFIENYEDVMVMLNKVLGGIIAAVNKQGQEYLKMWEAILPAVPEKIPQAKLAEVKNIIAEKYNYQIAEDVDIDPEGERLAGRWAKEEFNSDWLFLTHYPRKDRPFYTMPSVENPEETYGFDLIFRGVELVTGSQRIHEYQPLIDSMKKKGVKPEGLEFYLEVFKYAMPPHGGWAIGSERFAQLILGLGNVKEASLFPRDVKRLRP